MHVAFSGKMGAGKDLAARFYCELLTSSAYPHYPPVLRKFAAPTYQLAARLDGVEHWDPRVGYLGQPLPRRKRRRLLELFLASNGFRREELSTHLNHLLTLVEQTEGRGKNRERIRALAEYFRSVDPQFWIRLLASDHTAGLAAHETTVISDLRFFREAEWCRANGIFRIRIEASEAVRQSRLAALKSAPSPSDLQHPGECELDHYSTFTLTLDNNGTPEELRQQLLEALPLLYAKMHPPHSASMW